jgi:hypothetical protein
MLYNKFSSALLARSSCGVHITQMSCAASKDTYPKGSIQKNVHICSNADRVIRVRINKCKVHSTDLEHWLGLLRHVPMIYQSAGERLCIVENACQLFQFLASFGVALMLEGVSKVYETQVATFGLGEM